MTVTVHVCICVFVCFRHTDYRLFVVAMPDPCSETRLKNLFCRFGNFHKFKWQTGERLSGSLTKKKNKKKKKKKKIREY